MKNSLCAALVGIIIWGAALVAPVQACEPGFQDTTAMACRSLIVGSTGTKITVDANGNLIVTLGTLISGEDQTNNLLMTSGGAVRTLTVASGMVVGGDATMTTAVAVPVGSKSFNGIITGTGSITQTMKLYGSFASPITTTNGTLLCTLTLSGTTETSDTCPVVTANFPYYAVLTSGTTGTSATGVMKVGY